jgi:hypothetical protein
MRWLFAIVLVVGLTGVGCLNSPGCPCGAEPDDPFAEHDSSYIGEHVVDNECVCQCGADTPFGLPIDGECSEYNGPCIDDNGDSADLVCK